MGKSSKSLKQTAFESTVEKGAIVSHFNGILLLFQFSVEKTCTFI